MTLEIERAMLVTVALKQTQFMQAFAKKGRLKDLVERIPVHVITSRAALAGAASFGLESYKRASGAAS
jgi:glucokinase